MNHRRPPIRIDGQNMIEAANHRALGQMYRAYPSEATRLLEIFFGEQGQSHQYRRR